jgi:hypothetical protein
MARRNTSLGDFSQLWKRHENLYFGIFTDALRRLEINDNQRRDEDAISEALCPILRQICFEHPNKPALPQWEGPIQPASNNELKGGKIRKRPDFTCSVVNPFAQTPDMYEIPMHIECKRLGATVNSWNLNQNYVQNGVVRFDCLIHGYGKRAPSGMNTIISLVPSIKTYQPEIYPNSLLYF